MTLQRIQVSDFRCLRSVALDIDPSFTLISGPNASGKTSLLEAIHVLGRGRSFRSRRLDQLVNAESDRFVIHGSAQLSGRTVGLGIEGSVGGVRARVGSQPVSSLADLAVLLPVQIIDPELHRLIEEGPARRRRFLDWGVFHVEHTFLGQWQRFQQVLKQRNASLRARQARPLVAAWDGEFVRLGESIHRAREAYVERLMPVAADLARFLVGGELSVTYRPGWAIESSLADALSKSWTYDQERGSTTVGPHRSELSVRFNGAPAKDRVSRGQQKLLAAALLLAQLTNFPRSEASIPTLLLDDPAAELDSDRLFKLISAIADQALQLIVTSLTDDFRAFGVPGRRYRLSSGTVVQT